MLSKCFLYGLVLQTFLLNFVSALDVKGQYQNIEEVRVTLSSEEMNLQQFFKEVQRQTPFMFSFENRDLDRQLEISFAQNEGLVIDLLREVALQTELSFRQINHGIDVIKRSGKEEELISVADPIVISGVVSDENGEPLPGATISVQGASVGTVTDLDGKYTINVPEGSSLLFSYIGYETKRVKIGTQTVIDLQLLEDASSLEEVVVVGYGTQKKRDVTGAVNSIDNTKNETLPNTNVIQALRGTVPGLSIGAGGNAGSGNTISIRGQNSLGGNNNALVVVDGIIYLIAM